MYGMPSCQCKSRGCTGTIRVSGLGFKVSGKQLCSKVLDPVRHELESAKEVLASALVIVVRQYAAAAMLLPRVIHV